jgi:hypothetical protein
LLSSSSEPLSSSSPELLSSAPDFVPAARELLALLPRDLPLKLASLDELSPLSLAITSKVTARDTLDPSPCATRPGLAALVSLARLSSLGLLFLAKGRGGPRELLFFWPPSLTGGLLAALSTEDTIVSEAATDNAGELSCRRLPLTPDGPAVGRSSVSSGRLLAAAGVRTGAAWSLAFCCLGLGVEVVLAPPAAPFFFQAVPLVSPHNISPGYNEFLVINRSFPSLIL